MRLWWWRKIRRADIPKASRDLFERFGEDVIAMTLASGFTPAAPDLHPVYSDPSLIEQATQWLTERGDLRIRREQRLEAVEWAILLFAVMTVVVELLLLLRGGH